MICLLMSVTHWFSLITLRAMSWACGQSYNGCVLKHFLGGSLAKVPYYGMIELPFWLFDGQLGSNYMCSRE